MTVKPKTKTMVLVLAMGSVKGILGQGLVFCLPFRQHFRLNLGKVLFFSAKNNSGRVSFLFPFFVCLKMAKECCFCLSKRPKGRQKTRPPPYFCTLKLNHSGDTCNVAALQGGKSEHHFEHGKWVSLLCPP